MAHHILVLISDTVERIRLRGAFAGSGYEVKVLSRLAEIKDSSEVPHAIVTLPGDDPVGQMKRISAAFDAIGDAPAVVGFGAVDALTRLSAIRAGFSDVVSDTGLLRARLRDILRLRSTMSQARRRTAAARYLGLAEAPARFAPISRVTLVGDVSECVEIAAATRRNWRVERCNAARALRGDHRADVYVLAPESATDMLLPELRARPNSRRAAIICQFRDHDPASGVHALDARATDTVPDGASGEEVALRIERALERRREEDVLRRQTEAGLRFALTDSLTGLHNRRYAEAYLGEMLDGAKIANETCCAMMIDIDRFKEVNDSRGHAVGDRILRLTADLMRDNLRSMDLVARLGGDEFLVVMPATVPTEASLAAERLRTRFLDEVARMDRDLNVSLSIGVAVRAGIDGKTATVEGLLGAADRALYAAKAEGRNCVRLIPAA